MSNFQNKSKGHLYNFNNTEKFVYLIIINSGQFEISIRKLIYIFNEIRANNWFIINTYLLQLGRVRLGK